MKQVITSKITLKGLTKGVLYHYTSCNKFKRIIRSKAFHLSNYTNLKGDPDEIKWAFDKYNFYAQKLFPKNIDLTKIRPDIFYILSTCQRENNKHLWEEYGVDFSGVAIGIQANALYEIYNIRLHKIHMTLMEYNPEKFIELCKLATNFEPIPFYAPINYSSLKDCSLEEKAARFLDSIPGYREWQRSEENRDAMGAIALQKGKKYIPEEEYRIMHSSDGLDNQPLQITEDNKAILPLILGDGHLINEIVITSNCSESEGAIKRFLREQKIQATVRVIKREDIN